MSPGGQGGPTNLGLLRAVNPALWAVGLAPTWKQSYPGSVPCGTDLMGPAVLPPLGRVYAEQVALYAETSPS
jgi:hypothetical protein